MLSVDSSRLPQSQTLLNSISTHTVHFTDPSHILLREFMAVHHDQLDDSRESMDLVADTFRQFVVFLADEQDVADWLPTLRRYCYALMDRLGRPHWHVDWCLRSSDFTQMAVRALA